MITAFNLAETYRCPVFFMMDEVVGHMTERVAIPAADQIEIVRASGRRSRRESSSSTRRPTATWCPRW